MICYEKHHLLIDDGDDDGDGVRLVDWEELHAPAHPDAALEYLAELAHAAAGFPGPAIAAALLEWVAALPRPAEPYVREEPNPRRCFACGGADHAVCGWPTHWEILERMRAYLAKHNNALPKDPEA
jgi:hypothetical protein